jgi:hypothetical protein
MKRSWVQFRNGSRISQEAQEESKLKFPDPSPLKEGSVASNPHVILKNPQC